jgi:hypothetical protein
MSIFISIFLIAAFTVSAQVPFTGELEPVDDSGDGGTSIMKLTTGTETMDGKSVTVYTFTGEVIKGKQPEWPSISAELKPDAKTLEAMKAGKGIQFKAKMVSGTVSLKSSIAQSNVRDWGFHAKEIKINADTTLVTSRWSEFRQPSWAVRVPFNAARLTGMQLILAETDQAGKPFVIKVWDIEIIDK